MNKLLVTGGFGFLGSNIAHAFLQEGWQVTVVDNLSRQGSDQNKAWLLDATECNRLRFYEEDIADKAALDQVFREEGPFDYLCHLAGQVAMTTSLEDPLRDFQTNAQGALNILEAMRQYSPDALLAFSSTNKVYGDLHDLTYQETDTRFTIPAFPHGLDEATPLDFASPYGCSKGCADQYVRDWARNFGLKTVVFRHSSIYGGRQFASYDQGWIGWFCLQAQKQAAAAKRGEKVEPFTISGTGKQVRDVLHAEDLIRLYRTAWDCRADLQGDIFNIGGGNDNSLSLLELFEHLEQATGTSLQFRKLPRRQSDQDFFVADIRKAKEQLGWQPQVSKEEGLAAMLKWTANFV